MVREVAILRKEDAEDLDCFAGRELLNGELLSLISLCCKGERRVLGVPLSQILSSILPFPQHYTP